MRALSIRQPYAELILRGVKTAELRSRPTSIVGERFYIYACKQWAEGSGKSAGGNGEGAHSTGSGQAVGRFDKLTAGGLRRALFEPEPQSRRQSSRGRGRPRAPVESGLRKIGIAGSGTPGRVPCRFAATGLSDE